MESCPSVTCAFAPIVEPTMDLQHGVKPCAFASPTDLKTYSSKIVIYPCSFTPKYQVQDTLKNDQYNSQAVYRFAPLKA